MAKNKAAEEYIQENRRAWNIAAHTHKRYSHSILLEKFKTPGFSVLDDIQTQRLKRIGLRGKAIAHLCCNNGRELLSLKNLGAKRCVGFDISDELILQAKELAKASEIDCQFVRTNVLRLNRKYDKQFDLIYISVGTLSWIPSLSKLSSVVFRLLKPGGFLFIYELHPLLPILDKNSNQSSINIIKSYFKSGHFISRDAVTYYPGKYKKLPKQHLFRYTLSSIINAICNSGLRLISFEEFPNDISLTFKKLEKKKIQIPMSYILIAKKG